MILQQSGSIVELNPHQTGPDDRSSEGVHLHDPGPAVDARAALSGEAENPLPSPARKDGGEVMAANKSRCRYVLCTYGRAPVEIDIHDYHDPFDDIFLTYYVKAFRHLEEITSLRGLTFYIVWNYQIIRSLPTYGNDVVAVLLQDEACVMPHYLGKVRFVFKAYGCYPGLGLISGGINLTSILKAGKNLATWLRHLAVFLGKNGPKPIPRNRMVIPLGYARQTDLPVKPFNDRRYVISFIGSLENQTHRRSRLQAWFGTPKNIARSAMAGALRRLAPTMPDKVRFATTGSFHESIYSDGLTYSETMADSQICLAPRGSSVETYRFFEGLRQGCIVICNRLPNHWFYNGCPAIQLDNWRELDTVVAALLADPERMYALHRASLAWWEAKCSEQALAVVFAHCLGQPETPSGTGAPPDSVRPGMKTL